MNIFFISLILTFGAALASTTQAQSSDHETVLLHTVYFWFNDDVSADEHRNFYDELKKLKQIPHIQQGWIGVPADTEERGVIDNTYDYSITFVFENTEAEAEYQVHPIHLQFVETNADLWDNVVVYDAITP